jgi:hypothetical protein
MTFQADLINFIKARPEVAEYNELFNEFDAANELFQETWTEDNDNTPEMNAQQFALEAISDDLCVACADLITVFKEAGLNVWSYGGEGACWEIDLVTTEIDHRDGRPIQVTLCGKNYTP